MIFLDDSRGTWIVARDRAELLQVLLGHLDGEPDDRALTLIAAGVLGRLPTDIVIDVT